MSKSRFEKHPKTYLESVDVEDEWNSEASTVLIKRPAKMKPEQREERVRRPRRTRELDE